MISKESILEALSVIIDPDFKQDIVSLGFVKNIKIEDKEISFDIELTTAACPLKKEFESKAKKLVSDMAGDRTVNVQMTSQKKPEKKVPQHSHLNKVSSIIAISSCKGGVGKSTVAALIASTLAERGFKVGLLDADIYGPSIPTLFNPTKKMQMHENKETVYPAEFGSLKLMSFGFLLGDAPAVMRGPIVSKYIELLLHQVDWGELDYLFIDLPPGTGDIQLTITQRAQLDGSIIVTTPQTLSLVDVARGILMFEKVSVPMLGMIANMSYFMCKGCSDKQYIFGHAPVDKLQDKFGLPVLAELPVQPHLSMLDFHSKGKSYLNDDVNGMVDQVVRAIGLGGSRAMKIPKIQFDDAYITLSWPEGESISVSNKLLRFNSQDALSVNEVTGERILKEEDIRPDIKALEVTPLGNYAISVKWNDGHTAGIYPYKLIRELSQSLAKQ